MNNTDTAAVSTNAIQPETPPPPPPAEIKLKSTKKSKKVKWVPLDNWYIKKPSEILFVEDRNGVATWQKRQGTFSS